ncbi:MAG: hypothetical protein JKX85_12020 [Phycisphaeraceae bacterium]|nr:hypothetical protein [Phycisphaeraceae bacterium]
MTNSKANNCAHLDTTVLIDIHKADEISVPLCRELNNYVFKSASTYSKLEFKRAWLKALYYLYSKTEKTATIADILGILNILSSSYSSRKLKTVLEVFRRFLKIVTPNDSKVRISDHTRIKRLRMHLRNAILHGFEQFEKILTHQWNGTDCTRAKENPKAYRGCSRIDVVIPKCTENNTYCRIDTFYTEHQKMFQNVAAAISADKSSSPQLAISLPILIEAENNSKILRNALKCSKISDCIIAIDGHKVPVYIANNDDDWQLLANVLGKNLVNPRKQGQEK